MRVPVMHMCVRRAAVRPRSPHPRALASASAHSRPPGIQV